ncbi:hypothetical protein BV898_18962 [Hypsibius exemplaris]|uniref:Uncharacterized protein n=1 Tax=Hypsibius exemplaris TaxID=2072580 RepID=A0A9X6RP15_HYPEX|nr:hypothetical protein BV898_18962 [Hypsibius exemplaris]
MASACINALQFKFLKPQSVGLVPFGGYGGNGNQSQKALEWMTYVSLTENIEIQTIRSAEGEYKLDGGNITLDGFCQDTQTAYNFDGCFWHAHAKCYPLPHGYNPIRGCTYQEIRDETAAVQQRIRSNPHIHNLIVMNKCVWESMKKADPLNGQMLKDIEFVPRANPRSALIGGRVEVFCLSLDLTPEEIARGDRIRQDDFCSLYPFENLRGEYGEEHVTILTYGFKTTEFRSTRE